MPSPPLNKFCFCGDLKIGGFIIGSLQIGYYIITLIIAIIVLGMLSDARDAVIEQAKRDLEDHQTVETVLNAIAGIIWPFIVFRVIGIAASICLIVGTQKRNKYLILGYLICEGIMMGGLAIVWLFSIPGNRSNVGAFVFFLFLSLYMILVKYCWLCILSLYLLITNEQRASDPNNSQAMIPLQTIPENPKMFIPVNNAYQPQQQPLYIPQATNVTYPQQGNKPPAYPVQKFHAAEEV